MQPEAVHQRRGPAPVAAAYRLLDASSLSGSTPVVRDRSYVLNDFDGHACRLQGGNGAFSAGTGTFDTNLQLFNAKLGRFFGRLLRCTLAGERCTFATALKTTGSSARPTNGIAFQIGNRHHGVIERRLDVRYGLGDIATGFFLFCLRHSQLLPNRMPFIASP